MGKIAVLLFLLYSLALGAQQAGGAGFSQEQLTSATEELDYSETKKTLVPRSEPKKPTKKEKARQDPQPLKPTFSGSALAYTLGGILLLLILYYLFDALKTRRLAKPDNGDQVLDKIQNLEDEDLDALLDQMLVEENYSVSFRIQYLKLLQTLTIKKMIIWKANKTNGAYLRELRSGEIKDGVRNVNQVFDHTWYGNTAITKEDYLTIKDYVSRLQQKIQASDE